MCMNTDVLDKSKFKKQGVHVLAFGWQLPGLKLRMKTVLHSVTISAEIFKPGAHQPRTWFLRTVSV